MLLNYREIAGGALLFSGDDGGNLLIGKLQIVVHHRVLVQVHLLDFAVGVMQPALNFNGVVSVAGMQAYPQGVVGGGKNENGNAVGPLAHNLLRALGIDIQHHAQALFHQLLHLLFQRAVAMAVHRGVLQKSVLGQQLVILRVGEKMVMHAVDLRFPAIAGGGADREGQRRIDPRMPTLCAMRRRGFPGAAIRSFVEMVGLSKADSTVDVAMLESCVRDELGGKAPRVMAVLHPLKCILTNVPEDWSDTLPMENHPDHPEMGERSVTISREIWIEQEDFMEEPPKKFFRLKPEGEVRLKGAYIIKCEKVEHAADGSIDHVECTVDLDSRSGSEGANRKVKGTIHWVNARDCAAFEARLYDQLMTEEWDTADAADKKDVTKFLSPDSLQIAQGYCEHTLVSAKVGDTFQFLRNGYFCKDPDSTAEKAVYNRVVNLKSSFQVK